MSDHLSNCTTGPDDTEFVEGRTEYHTGPDRCPACDEDWAIVNEGERRAEFGFGWVTSGGDPADAGAAFHQHEAHVAEALAHIKAHGLFTADELRAIGEHLNSTDKEG